MRKAPPVSGHQGGKAQVTGAVMADAGRELAGPGNLSMVGQGLSFHGDGRFCVGDVGAFLAPCG